MDLRRLSRFLVAVLITAGLTGAPLVTPAAAQAVVAVAMADDASGMAADMPCCPEKQKQSDCQDCPLLAICMIKVLQSGPAANGLPIQGAKGRTLPPLDQPEIAGLIRPPPDQPPRTIL
jgi:hypothetical protein